METGLAIIFHAHIPAQYCVHAFSSSVYIINRLPTKVLSMKFPFAILFNRFAAYDIFIRLGVGSIRIFMITQLTSCLLEASHVYLLGIILNTKAINALTQSCLIFFITQHTRFDELNFPLGGSSTAALLASLSLHEFIADVSVNSIPSSIPVDKPIPRATSITPLMLSALILLRLCHRFQLSRCLIRLSILHPLLMVTRS